MITADQISTLIDDGQVVDADGEKVGGVGQVYLDDASGQPQWVTVSTGLFGTSESFVPLRGATLHGDSEVRVAYLKDVIKDAPRVGADSHLEPEEEDELYRYYQMDDDRDDDRVDDGVDDWSGDRDGRRDEGHDTSGPDTDDAMTRSEEQVQVHTERVPAGRARLRKYVVTEQATTTVPVEREEVRVEREPITEANRDQAMAGGDLTEEEHELTLHEDRVVVDKETVPVERVRLGKETVTDQQQVSEQVRKEQIEAEVPDDDAEGRRR